MERNPEIVRIRTTYRDDNHNTAPAKAEASTVFSFGNRLISTLSSSTQTIATKATTFFNSWWNPATESLPTYPSFMCGCGCDPSIDILRNLISGQTDAFARGSFSCELTYLNNIGDSQENEPRAESSRFSSKAGYARCLIDQVPTTPLTAAQPQQRTFTQPVSVQVLPPARALTPVTEERTQPVEMPQAQVQPAQNYRTITHLRDVRKLSVETFYNRSISSQPLKSVPFVPKPSEKFIVTTHRDVVYFGREEGNPHAKIHARFEEDFDELEEFLSFQSAQERRTEEPVIQPQSPASEESQSPVSENASERSLPPSPVSEERVVQPPVQERQLVTATPRSVATPTRASRNRVDTKFGRNPPQKNRLYRPPGGLFF